jgi:hypothetical protein
MTTDNNIPNTDPSDDSDGRATNPPANNDQNNGGKPETEEEKKLKALKEKLDSAYEQRDAALRKAAEEEQRRKDLEIERLKEQGKVAEALEAQLAQEKAAREAAEKRAVELSRDAEVRALLGGLDFRTAKASDAAFRDIVSELVQNDNKIWMHKSGVGIAEYIERYKQDPENAYLFKVKANNGGGSSNTTPTGDPYAGKPLNALPTEQILKLAREGKLPNQRQNK